MRTALRSKSKRGTVSGVFTLDAPIKGWIANENIAKMPVEGAYRLDNWFPETDRITMRPGFDEHADLTGSDDPVNTVMVHDAGGTKTVFAAQDDDIFDVTEGGDISSAAVSSLTSDQWSWTNFATSGGNFLFIVNAADSARHYNGTSWATPSITGVNSNTFSQVWGFANRLFFIEEDSTSFAYLPVDSVAGAATSFEVGGELSLGGVLVAGAALTHDAGFGPEDYCVLLSSEGEVVVYQGTDPANSDTWSKKGRFRIGRPVGNRCMLKIGGDIAVLTQDGVVSLARSILLDRAAASRGAFSDNIRKAFADRYALSGTLFGWQIVTWPAGHMAIVNVPVTDQSEYHQYVMNVLTGAWCRFTGIDVACWALAGDDLYMGSLDGRVMQFNTAGGDDGETVNAVAIGAFSDFGKAGVIKHVKAAQAFARTDGQVTIGVNMTADFAVSEQAASSAAFGAADGAVWDTALWDQAVWAESEVVDQVWLGVAAAGYYIAPIIVGQVSGDNNDVVDADFYTMKIIHEAGALLG